MVFMERVTILLSSPFQPVNIFLIAKRGGKHDNSKGKDKRNNSGTT